MLLGATVLCFLVLLALLADRYGSRIFHGDGDRTYYRCAECDLRYPRRQIHDPRFQVCPAGHPVIAEEAGVSAGLIGIFVCLGFLLVALLLLLTGVVS
jgi:hypothetical protein